ncbi:ankyrin repeat domain-containing protein 61 [Eublepharis macularius]|uniref:Ankyrin repeat domain-containing protein 61 n=1 Tax=Eublepharis macularius TaxID=481883 RepID=A0AA97K438_EUBMA|nr:ankyrin repeat domain-containing protein 61 [Eublepharis macularius]
MDASGLTGLHLASKNLKLEIIQLLLYCGANVNLANPETGQSALHFAILSSSSKGGVTLAAGAECVEVLLHNGAQARMRDRNGIEAIHFACRCGRKDLVTLLLDHGADIDALTSQQESPLYLFLEEKRNQRKVQLLDKLLSLSYPLKLTNSKGCLPKGLLFPHARQLKDALLRMASDVLSLQEICKFNIRKIYGEKMKWWLQKKLPTTLWNSIYVYQEFSYASKIKPFD